MDKVKAIPNPYITADRTLLDKIEKERPCTNGILAMWWRVGGFICTRSKEDFLNWCAERGIDGKSMIK